MAVIRGELRDYVNRHPGAAEVAIVIEVADSSLLNDRRLKLHIYASEGLPVYWIVNLLDRRLEVHWDASGPVEHPEYRHHAVYDIHDEVPVILAGSEIGKIHVADVLP